MLLTERWAGSIPNLLQLFFRFHFYHWMSPPKMNAPISFLWQTRPTNAKTGVIPTAYVGHSYDDAKASCVGCAIRAKCYAYAGTPKMGMMSMVKAAAGKPFSSAAGTPAVAPGGRYSLSGALAARKSTARATRLGAIGDPSRVGKREFHSAVKTIRALGLRVLGYTHFWREYRNRGLRGSLMASCDTLGQADDALASGWRPAAITEMKVYCPDGSKLPLSSIPKTFETPAGETLVTCPAQRKGHDRITCNECRLCDPSHPFWARAKAIGVAFLDMAKPRKAAAK